MSARPRDGLDAAFIRLIREMTPRQARAVRDMIERMIDGQPAEAALIEAVTEVGRRSARSASAFPRKRQRSRLVAKNAGLKKSRRT